ncbi:MAG: glycosyltransferase family 39 protein [Nostocales cyanobacterium]|nr:MAG: glycosyltransferase family 39 protein [Nostocales cyanobacterium]TAF18630.1 MAG: glycosyltransferase family 39 protein [Nostocales cyanobacterium]
MFYKSPLLWNLQHQIFRFPYVSICLWLIPLLLFNSGEISLMAHDESLYAARARLMFESGNWISPWENAHHKTPGFYWIIAIFYQLFGVSEITARIPAMIAGILIIFVIYEIGKILLGEKLGYFSAAILSVEFLWLQYSRLVAPDIPTLLLVFTAILYLLKSESTPRYRYQVKSQINYHFIVGLCFGLGFLMRSFMIFLPMIALLPYLIGENYRHRHLSKPMLYVGFLVGLIPTFIWLLLSWRSYGGSSIGQLLEFVLHLGSREQHGNNILFYIWNIPLKSFPWFLFAILGVVSVIRYPIRKYQLLLVGFPLVLFIEISLFPTRFSHYSLGIYPFIAMFASLGLEWLGKMYQISRLGYLQSSLPRNFSYGFGILGLVFFLFGLIALLLDTLLGIQNIESYIILAIIAGLSCLTIPAIWILRHHFNYKNLNADAWICAWLFSAWLSIASAGILGLLGNFNPDFKTFFQQETITNITKNQPIHFVRWASKYAELIYFYTPIPGKNVNEISELSPSEYAWIYTQNPGNLNYKHKVIDSINDYELIKILPQ